MKRIQRFSFAPSLLLQTSVCDDRHTSGIQYLLIIGLTIVIGLISALPTRAQDRPTAFGSDAELSAANKAEYKRVADQYKALTLNKTAANAAARKDLRNQLISLTIAQTDLNFLSYQKKTRHRRAIFETLMDILEIGTSTAISIMNGERARTVTSELLGFLQLGRQSFNKNFSLKDTQILFNKMVAKRAEKQTSIIDKMNLQEDDQYSFATAMIDLIAYYRAGTIDGALEDLNIDTGHEAQQALVALDQAKFRRPSTKVETALAQDSLSTLRDLQGQLKDPAKKGAALAKLQTIIAELNKDNAISPFLKAASISAAETDGDKLIAGLIGVRRALNNLDPPNFELLNKVNKIIIDNGN